MDPYVTMPAGTPGGVKETGFVITHIIIIRTGRSARQCLIIIIVLIIVLNISNR